MMLMLTIAFAEHDRITNVGYKIYIDHVLVAATGQRGGVKKEAFSVSLAQVCEAKIARHCLAVPIRRAGILVFGIRSVQYPVSLGQEKSRNACPHILYHQLVCAVKISRS